MSYYTDNKVLDEPPKKVNPRHTGKSHRPEAKEAISKTQKTRYDLLRAAVENAKNPLTEERVMQIVRETVADYIKNNTNKTIDIRL